MTDEPDELFLVSAGSEGNKRLGLLLKDLREQNNLKPATVANMVGVSASFITGIERGTQAPSRATAGRIFGCMQKTYGLTWLPRDEAFDLILKDPKTNRDVAFKFKFSAGGRGQTKIDPFVGFFEIEFIRSFKRAQINGLVVCDQIAYLIGEDGSIYNWSNIILMKRISD